MVLLADIPATVSIAFPCILHRVMCAKAVEHWRLQLGIYLPLARLWIGTTLGGTV